MGDGDSSDSSSDQSSAESARLASAGDSTAYVGASQAPEGGWYRGNQTSADQSAAETARLAAMNKGDNTLGNIGQSSGTIADQHNWSIGPNGQIYGNIQNAAADLGIRPSQAGISIPSWLSALSPKLAGMLSGIGSLQDMGLPGYSMTPEERAIASSFGNSSSSRRGYDFGLMTSPQQVSQQSPQVSFGSPFVNSVGLFQNSIPANQQVSYSQQPSVINGLFRGYI